jgi:glycerol transport system ATP-binding protein
VELGVRPEFVTFAAKGLPVNVVKVSDIGRYRVVDTRLGENSVKLIVPEGAAIPEGKAHLAFDKVHTQIYNDGWLAGEAR